jgi:hypothetical protein
MIGMNKKVTSLTLAFVFLLSAKVVTSSGQTRTVGVSEGDWFMYDVDFSWYSTDPSETIPWWNETEGMRITIVAVSGKNVSSQFTYYYSNGTQKTFGGYVNIETGEGDEIPMFAVSADLAEHDTVYTSGWWSSAKINETIVRPYPNGVRDTNHLNITIIYSSELGWQSNLLNYYWDRPTGVLVESSEAVYTEVEGYVTIHYLTSRLAASNAWFVPEFPSYLILPLFMITTLLAVIVYKRKLVAYKRKL